MPMLITLAVVIIAAFLAWRLIQTRHDAPAPTRRRPPAPRGPDDDPDFLNSLEDR